MWVTRRALGFSILLLAVVLAISCSRAPQPAPNASTSTAEPQVPIPAGRLRDNHIEFQFAIYYLPQPTSDPLAELRRILGENGGLFEQVDKLSGPGSSPQLTARLESNPRKNYAPPDLQSLGYFGRGVSREQAESLQTTESALILNFSYSSDSVWSGMRSAAELTETLARTTGGLVWDETTREVFSPDAWKERRLDGWTEEFPDVKNFTVIHAYKQEDSDFVRCVTLGMEKFGLPDIVINNSSWSLNRNIGHIVNLFAQATAEGAVPRTAGQFDLDIRSIKNSQVRSSQVDSLRPNATGVALLSLSKGSHEEGDPPNRLIEITFDRGTGPEIHAKQEQVIAAAFGWEDPVTQVNHDKELKAASRQARTKLSALQTAFRKGLAPGEFIQVKAPFDTPEGGREWMWVEITSWDGDKMTGLLKNEPRAIPSLHGGQVVEVSATKVFDYLHTKPDGTEEGNETGKLIERQTQ